MNDPTVYLNGEYKPLSEAQVSVLDRGFLFGDGVYEVIPVYGGRLFRITEHLRRLENSLDAIRIPNPLSDHQWTEIISKLVDSNSGGDQSVYLQVTRGVAPKRDHSFPKEMKPSVFIMSNPLTQPVISDLAKGIKAITLADSRWLHCNIKAITLLPNVLLRQQAVEQECGEAILIREGKATEGAASNLFVVSNGTIVTPPKGPHILPGITRDLVVELATANDLVMREEEINAERLTTADEIWLTSSTREIIPVIELDGTAVGTGEAGSVWQKMIHIYQDFKDQLRQPAN